MYTQQIHDICYMQRTYARYLQNTVFPDTFFCSLCCLTNCRDDHSKYFCSLWMGTCCSNAQCHNGVGKEREYGPELLQGSDEMLWKKQCCKSGRGERQARRWECGEDKSRPQEIQSTGASEGVKVIKSASSVGSHALPLLPMVLVTPRKEPSSA